MKKGFTKTKWLLVAIVVGCSLTTTAALLKSQSNVVNNVVTAIDGEGKYFTLTFDEKIDLGDGTFLGSESTYPYQWTVNGEVWELNKAFVELGANMKTNYVKDGSAGDLRMPKDGSYIISPTLTSGVSKVTFDICRGSNFKVYTSTDNGTTWTAATVSGGTAVINSESVNRIKVANESSKDCDIDNLSIYAQTFDQPVTVSTGDATDIEKTTATVSGAITKAEQTVTEVGIVWSISTKEPSLKDNVVAAPSPENNFTITLSELREGGTVYYRAYAKYGDTYTYGEVKSFKTQVSDTEQTIDADGKYFTQSFEPTDNVPAMDAVIADTEMPVIVPGQGEWIYYNAFFEVSADYIVTGTQDLRLPKVGYSKIGASKGSYVATPVLNKGVKKVVFNSKRNKGLEVYTSTDGGSTWTLAEATSGTGEITVTIENLNVNRIKIANNKSGDCDIDDLSVYAEAFGTPATVTTGAAESITKNSAIVYGNIVDAGDQPITEKGIIWSSTNNLPSLSDNKEESEDLTSNNITSMITGLKANTTVYYRAYALSNAGYAFGDVQSFVTSPATAAVVATSDLTKSKSSFRIGGAVTDDGGADIVEVGVIYGTTPGLDINNGTKITMERPTAKFSTNVSLAASTTYYVRAYAITTFSSEPSYGEVKQFTTEEAVEIPDEIKGDEIWCSPNGDDATADGSEAKPFYDLQKAIDIAQPGDRIWMKAGTYVYDKRIDVNDRNGEADKYIEVFVYPKDSKQHAILDFSGMPYHAHSDNPLQGIRHTSSYWHYYKIDITNASDNGFLLERNKPTGGSAADIINRPQDGHDNIIEQCNFYKNGDTGLQIKNLGYNNYIINCDSYLNCDEEDGDADGFAPKISVGDGNYFYGCRAWLNSDDGYDVFFKKQGGFEDNETIIFDYCIASRNGKLEDGKPSKGNANGFKTGSDQGRMNVYLNRCIAAANGSKGFDQNHNSGDIIMNNCTGIAITSETGGKNVDEAYSYKIYEALQSGSVCKLTNCISIGTTAYVNGKDIKASKTGSPYGGIRVDESIASLDHCNLKADPSWFVDLSNYIELEGERAEDGSIPETTFAHLKETLDNGDPNPLVAAGTKVTDGVYRGVDIPGIRTKMAELEGVYYDDFNADYVPSLGAYEVSSNAPTAIGRIDYTESDGKAVRLVQCQNGMVVIGVNGAKSADEFKVVAFDATGKALGQHKFNATGSIFLPNVQGVIILKVTGNGVDETIKVVMK